MKKNFYISFIALLLLCSSVFAVKKEVVYVRSGATITKGDSITISAIAGYADSSLYHVTELVTSDLNQSDLTTLNAADVVIMGRNIGSLVVQADMGIWDSITKPVISMNMWALRTTRAKWVNNGSTNNFTKNDTVFVTARILKTDDPVFKGLSSDTVNWWHGSYSHFTNDGSKENDGGNGEVLAITLDSIPVFIRWKAGEEFYPGAGHFPLAERSYIGLAGDGGINYFNFPNDMKEVFFSELNRLGSAKPAELGKRKISSLSALSVSVGKLTPGFTGSTLKYTVTLPYGTTDVPTVATATPTDAGAKVTIDDATSLTDSATITVTAEDPTVQSVYVIHFAITPVNKDATLSSLEISEGTLVPDFSADVTEYTVTLPAGTTTVPTVKTAKAKSTFATVAIVDAASFDVDATITVTAQDVTVTKVYKINYDLTVGINNSTLSNVTFYPNPATDRLTFKNAASIRNIEIMNMSGQIMMRVNQWGSSINISGLSQGVYIVRITNNDNTTIMSKLIKK
jgi:hypothetical protein